MVKITVGIEGMACGMCEAHINEAVRSAFQVKKVTSAHTKKQTVIIAEEDIPEQELKNAVAKAGYSVVSVSSEPYEKKGIFGIGRKSGLNDHDDK
ncbi:MAG: cation transporter [Acetatifactor sp.]|nr:cation transporter [Acetatifactor sp.]